MSTATWIAIGMPIFILLFIILPQQNATRKLMISRKYKKKGAIKMTNDIIKKYVGKKCIVSTGSYGMSVIGEIISVEETWIEVETKKGIELINSEFVQSIKIKSN